MSCRYERVIKARFGRKISAEEANAEFDAIEAAMTCLESLANSSTSVDSDIHNYGTITNETTLDPAFGNMQLLTVEGDVDLDFKAPDEDDPRVIYLLISDGGSGTFSFPSGSVWATKSQGTSVTGIPWDPTSLGGEYGAVVVCIYDSIGWIYMAFSRNDIDFNAAVNVTDIYSWR